MFGTELVEAFREFKSIWDPDWKMNPGKIVDPFRMDRICGWAPVRRRRSLETHFQFPDDRFSFSRATTAVCRCGEVPAGRRRTATMCPSYMVTREEMGLDSRPRRLLFEMMQGDP